MMTRRRSSLLVTLALLTAPLAAAAADMPSSAPAAATAAPSPSAAEAVFLVTIARELPKRYPTPAAATKAGYARFTNEDATGAISYANSGASWTATDPLVPPQLWYDVRGRLIGADYSVLQSAVAPGAQPSVLGIDAQRFGKIGAHVHYVTCDKATGRCTYGKAVGAKKYADANGGDFSHPTAAGLVKAGAVKDASTVKTVFLYPAIYDAAVWVVPNPLGQFADKNPAVTPSPAAGKGEDDAM
jgi:hypothetical protein